jgi:2-amino-4-hydroxy-6-hydroxymethyldihydropteridine diphosphokinase
MTAFIALGSNLNNPHLQLKKALESLAQLGHIVAKSSLYKTVPVGGPKGQASYLNAVIELEPFDLYQNPYRLLKALLSIEVSQGRERRIRWDARTLDLDLLIMGDTVVHTDNLSLPHPRMMQRAFVLVPLCEIAPGWQHPQTLEYPCNTDSDPSGIIKTALDW